MSNYTSLLRSKSFLAVFLSQTFVDLGDQFLLVALSWTILNKQGGADLGLVLAAWAVPRGVLLLFGGVFSDRSDKRLMAVLTAVGVSLVALLAAFSIFGGWSSLGLWLVCAVCLGVLDALRLPIGYSLIPLVLPQEKIIDANRWTQLREWGSTAVGPALAGVLLALWGSGWTFVTISLFYLVSSLFLLLLPPLPSERTEDTRILQDLKDGLLWVVKDTRLRILLPAFAFANLFILGILSVGIVVFAKNHLQVGPEGLGYLSTSLGIGLIVGTLLMPLLPKWMETSMPALFMFFILSDATLGIVGLVNSLPLACMCYFLSGLFMGPAATLYRTSLQTLTPTEYLGRVSSLARAMSFGLQPVSTALYGSLSTTISAGALITVGGLCATFVDCVGLFLGAKFGKAPQMSFNETVHNERVPEEVHG